jgi:hypothetical protein
MNRQALHSELQRLAQAATVFSAVDVALAVGAGEPQIAKTLIGLAAEGHLEKVEPGKYRVSPVADLTLADFLKALTRSSKIDSTRQRDLGEIARLKQNNDTMRARLLQVVAERDRCLELLRQHNIALPQDPSQNPSQNLA